MPGWVGLGCIRKIAEQVRRSKLVSSVPPSLLCQFLLPVSCLPSMMDYGWDVEAK